MARSPRKVSKTGLYHVITRGNGKQILFEDDADRCHFLATMQKSFTRYRIVLIAWCLMDNHVHLIVREDGDACGRALSEAMRVLSVTYAKRYNAKTGHVGHVFQGRYESLPIENLPYLLQAIRYVHANPEQAGICPAAEYRWSSYWEYLSEPLLCDTSIVLDEVGGAKGFVEFSKQPAEYELVRRLPRRISDEDVLATAVTALQGVDPRSIKAMPKAERNAALRVLRAAHLTVKQIVRLTGIGYTTISQATKNQSSVPDPDDWF